MEENVREMTIFPVIKGYQRYNVTSGMPKNSPT